MKVKQFVENFIDAPEYVSGMDIYIVAFGKRWELETEDISILDGKLVITLDEEAFETFPKGE